jgi:stress-induced morphogen
MAISQAELTNFIKTAFPDAEINITALVDDGDHYSADIKSNAFIGKTRVQQHQMVYEALQGRMGAELHALALHTGPLDK